MGTDDDGRGDRPPELGTDTVVVAPSAAPTIRVDDNLAAAKLTEPASSASMPAEPKLWSGAFDNAAFGRFEILDVLGAGGMGVVLAARDPQLDRKVAIKVLRTRGVTGARRQREAVRLLREARALAQLAHPHVVTVFEAGTIDDRVFIAMEYVDGVTLREWLRTPRSAQDILDVFVGAGRGLAAGHAAGVVHRDFKPDNVLIGSDGRARVIDFGLARPTRGALDPDELDTPAPHAPVTHLTTASFGTPIYMAPEQHRHDELDARVDQFAYCVALYEALYARLPFEGATYAELVVNVTEGALRAPPARPAVPARVTAALARGLRVDPRARFPTMDALLDELVPPSRRVQRTIAFAAIAAAVAVAGTLAAVHFAGSDAPAPPVCDGGASPLDGAWDEVHARAAFVASGRSHAAATFDRVAVLLHAYADAVVATRREVCEATRVRAERPVSALDLGMRCLAQREDQLHALVGLFANAPDAQIVDHAIAAVVHLPRPDACAYASSGAVPEPTSPADQATLRDLSRGRAELEAYLEAGKYAAAAERATALLPRAKALHYAPIEAALDFDLGQALHGDGKPEGEAALREAIRVAAIAKDDALSAEAYVRLIGVLGFEQAHYAEAIALEPVAAAAIARADGGDKMKGDLAFNLGLAYFTDGEYAKAVASFRSAVDLRGRALGDADPDIAEVHNSLGGALFRLGDIAGAKHEFELALAIRDKALGEMHPDVATSLANLGAVAQMQGDKVAAMKYGERALRLLEEVNGPDHVNVGLTLMNLGTLHGDRGDFDEALRDYTRALAILEKLGPSHPYVAMVLVNRADVLVNAGKPADAIADAERAIAILATQKDEAQLAEARFNLARALWDANRDRPHARELVAQARAVIVAAGPAGADTLAHIDEWIAKHKP